jgi:hypothetical protein
VRTGPPSSSKGVAYRLGSSSIIKTASPKKQSGVEAEAGPGTRMRRCTSESEEGSLAGCQNLKEEGNLAGQFCTRPDFKSCTGSRDSKMQCSHESDEMTGAFRFPSALTDSEPGGGCTEHHRDGLAAHASFQVGARVRRGLSLSLCGLGGAFNSTIMMRLCPF